jgi:membrane-associated protease RseP (regulator of RpoE activity)
MQPHLAFFLFLSTIVFAGTPAASGGDGGEIFTHVKSPPPRGYLGVYTQDMTADLARSMNVKTGEGALVTEVMEDTPAEKAGLQNEDIIVGFDGKQIRDARDLLDAVRKSAPGVKVDLVVMRKDEKKTLQAELGKTRRSSQFGVAPVPPVPPVPPRVVVMNLSQSLGLRVREISDQLAKYFDAPTDDAVLVEEVKEKSDAATAGIMAGDVILKVGDKTVEDVRDFRRSVRTLKEGDTVNIELLRKGARRNVTVNVTDTPGERRHHSPPHGRNFFFHHDPDFDTDFDFDFDFDIDVDVEGLEEGMEELHHELEGLGGRIKKELRRAKEELKSIKRWT